MHTIVGTSPVQDPHPEQAKEDWIINMSLVDLSKPFCPLDHIGPKAIIEEQVWVYVPPPVVNDSLIVRFPRFNDSMEGILGDLYPFR